MNVNDLFPSKYLKAHDLGGKAFTLTIRAATLEDVGHGAEKEREPVDGSLQDMADIANADAMAEEWREEWLEQEFFDHYL